MQPSLDRLSELGAGLAMIGRNLVEGQGTLCQVRKQTALCSTGHEREPIERLV